MTEKDKQADPSAEPVVPGAQALVKGLDVLMAIGMAPAPMRFGELQEAVGIPKGSLHRLLAALQSRRLIRCEENGRRYALGSRVMDLARRTIDQSAIIKAAKPELTRVARQLTRACCLYVKDGDEVFVLDFEDPDASQARVVRVWPRLPASQSAPGLAICAWLPPGERQDQENVPALGQAKALGYAIGSGELPAIAAPVMDSAGYPVAAICCHYDTGNDSAESLHEAGRLVREAAQRASGNVVQSDKQSHISPRPDHSDPAVRVLNTGRDFMGENPVWCSNSKRLWWLDVLAPALRCLHIQSGETERFMLDDLTGGLALTRSGSLLLAGQSGIQLFNPDNGKLSLLCDPEKDKPDNRFNSASLDTDGNLWVGTMPVDGITGSGSLYRLGPDLSVRVMIREIGMPKNAAWSPDGNSLYITDGRQARLCRHAVADDGSLGDAETFVQGNDDSGTPNGIAMDSEGCVWVAMLGGWAVNRYDPGGNLMQSIKLPVPMPIALTFGGPELKQLFVTTTYIRLPPGYSSSAPQSGNLIAIDTEVSGIPTRIFSL